MALAPLSEGPLVPKAVVLPAIKVAPETAVVAPVYEFAPPSVNDPVPFMVTVLPAPVRYWLNMKLPGPVNVTLPAMLT